MSTNIELTIKKRIGEDTYNDNYIILFYKSPLNIAKEPLEYIWEGSYEDSPIKVTLRRHLSPEFADIEGIPNIPNIRKQIVNEIKRILHPYN